MSENVPKISTKQSRAIAALMFHGSLEEAALACGMSTKTLSRWLTQPEFRAALTLAESELLNQATRRLVMLSEKAISTLEKVLNDTTAPQSVRVRAAGTVLDNLLKLRENMEFDQRLEELEKRMAKN